MKSFTYLLVDIGCILVPFIFSFYSKRAFYKEWKSFFLSNIIVAVLFLIWDAIFTMKGIWGFNPDYLTELYIFNLPIEEILFFVCIPYACIFTYFALKYLVKKSPLSIYQKYITLLFTIFLILVGLFSLDKAYTGLTFLLTGVYLIFQMIFKKDLSYHYLAYFIILPFFFISNGILTGSFLEEPIVWYNNQENLEIRLFTIPMEDIFYGMLLIFMNIDLYEFFKKRSLSN